MAVEKYFTLDNILKVVLAIAVGILLYKIFFKKEETYYDYQGVYGDKSGYAYPMDYENSEEPQEMIDEYAADDEDEVVEEVVEDYEDEEDEEDEVVEEDMEDYEDEDEVVIDDEADADQYDYEDESGEPYDDTTEETVVVEDAENEDYEIPDEIYEEADEETADADADAFEYLYADDVAEGLEENFTLYSNLVGVDTSYD